MSQKLWNDSMIDDFTECVSTFIDALENAIWQPARQTRAPEGSSTLVIERIKRLQPILMPRLHILSVHAAQFVRHHSMFGCFSEDP